MTHIWITFTNIIFTGLVPACCFSLKRVKVPKASEHLIQKKQTVYASRDMRVVDTCVGLKLLIDVGILHMSFTIKITPINELDITKSDKSNKQNLMQLIVIKLRLIIFD